VIEGSVLWHRGRAANKNLSALASVGKTSTRSEDAAAPATE